MYSVILGHVKSCRLPRVLVRGHEYSVPWVHARQEQLEQDLSRAWKQDPVALMETKATPEVRGKNERYN
jgi:hypothetical protein